jgi:prophage regulatory protein
MAATVRNVPPTGDAQLPSEVIPRDGNTRWSTLKKFVPLSHESVRQREKAGRFPKRVQPGSARCVAWPNRELHCWFADPNSYRVEV